MPGKPKASKKLKKVNVSYSQRAKSIKDIIEKIKKEREEEAKKAFQLSGRSFSTLSWEDEKSPERPVPSKSPSPNDLMALFNQSQKASQEVKTWLQVVLFAVALTLITLVADFIYTKFQTNDVQRITTENLYLQKGIDEIKQEVRDI
jgi:predicted amidophosphoribosyltransferase